MPNSSSSSSAIRASPQVGLSAAIAQISSRSSVGSLGLPRGLDFQRQNKRNPLWCQRMRVSGLTMTRALRRSKNLLRTARNNLVASIARSGLTSRSWYRASCFRRNRFSAARALRDRKLSVAK